MGYFLYADNRQIKLDDRALVHLQIVIIDKLRRGESFSLTLVSENRLVMMWLNAATPCSSSSRGIVDHVSIWRGSS